MEGVFVVSNLSASLYLKMAGPTWKIQSLPKLRQVWKWQAEIQDILLGLTGIGNFEGLWHCEEHVKTMFFLQWQARVEWQNDEQNTLFLRWQARVEWQNDQQKHSFCAGKLERSCRMISKTHSFCAGKLEWIGRMISKTQTFCAGKLEWIGRMISKNTLFGKLEWSGWMMSKTLFLHWLAWPGQEESHCAGCRVPGLPCHCEASFFLQSVLKRLQNSS